MAGGISVPFQVSASISSVSLTVQVDVQPILCKWANPLRHGITADTALLVLSLLLLLLLLLLSYSHVKNQQTSSVGFGLFDVPLALTFTLVIFTQISVFRTDFVSGWMANELNDQSAFASRRLSERSSDQVQGTAVESWKKTHFLRGTLLATRSDLGFLNRKTSGNEGGVELFVGGDFFALRPGEDAGFASAIQRKGLGQAGLNSRLLFQLATGETPKFSPGPVQPWAWLPGSSGGEHCDDVLLARDGLQRPAGPLCLRRFFFSKHEGRASPDRRFLCALHAYSGRFKAYGAKSSRLSVVRCTLFVRCCFEICRLERVFLLALLFVHPVFFNWLRFPWNVPNTEKCAKRFSGTGSCDFRDMLYAPCSRSRRYAPMTPGLRQLVDGVVSKRSHIFSVVAHPQKVPFLLRPGYCILGARYLGFKSMSRAVASVSMLATPKFNFNSILSEQQQGARLGPLLLIFASVVSLVFFAFLNYLFLAVVFVRYRRYDLLF